MAILSIDQIKAGDSFGLHPVRVEEREVNGQSHIRQTHLTDDGAVDKFNGTDTPGLIWQAIERRLGN